MIKYNRDSGDTTEHLQMAVKLLVSPQNICLNQENDDKRVGLGPWRVPYFDGQRYTVREICW